MNPLKPADLDFLLGDWSGKLEYLNYSDNKTKQTLAVTMKCETADGGPRYRFQYTEPNGKKVEGDATRVAIDPKGDFLKLGDEQWVIEKSTLDANAGKFAITLSRDGKDGDKPAKLRRVIAREKDKLTIRTEVSGGTDEPILVRNEYTLEKK